MRLLSFCLLVALAVPSVGAQHVTPYGAVEGSRVRITAPALSERPLHGWVVAFAGDSLVLASSRRSARARLPLGEVRVVEVSDGRDRLGTAVFGAGIGALLGAVLGGAGLGQEGEFAALVGAFAGVVIGAPIGGVAGALLAPERWRAVWGGGLR